MRSVLLFLAFAAFFPVTGLEASLKVANGRVEEVGIEKRELILVYHHPVTQRDEKLVLQVGEKTGFPEDLEFEELQPGDPVSVDYQEEPGEKAEAVLIKRVPIRGVPKSLSH